MQINAYVTPPENQGFAAHYDNHDVFVLQIAGTKRWRIHEPVLRDPLPDQKWEQRRGEVAARAAEEPLLDTVLAPGDALYLPRGYLHSATALGELTIHLTVGVHPVTRYALARELLEAATADPALRESLPMGAELADPGVLSAHLAATARALAGFAEHGVDAHADRVADRVATMLAAGTRPEPLAPLAQGAAAATLTPTTALRARAGLRYTLRASEDAVVLKVIDRTVSLPANVATALKGVLSGEPFAVSELAGLDPAEQLVLARRLLREGVLVPVTDR